jgi:peptidoglycan/LPS O-acetylase OafA/YrhL
MASTQTAPGILKSKHHFEILDGLRGIAAICVVIFHFMEFVAPDPLNNFAAHTYLAVDFFFCLSGFVIAYAYDNRLKEIGIATFFKLRLIRLHPLVIIGSVLGLLTFIFDPLSTLYQKYGAGQTVLMFITSCLMLPYALVKERYFNNFHFNPPTWSLFWEYIANIFYAFVFYRMRNKLLWVFTVIAIVCLCYTAFIETNLSVGWSGDNLMGGGARVFFSFLAGMLVYRTKFIIKSKLGFLGLSILLVLTFLFPYIIDSNWFIDPLIVILYFPVLVALGAGVSPSPKIKNICKLSGNISYPLYMVHYPFLWLLYSYIEVYKPTMAQMQVIIPVGLLLLIALAYFILIYVDEPIRRYLKGRLVKA